MNESTCDKELLESLVLLNLTTQVAETPFLKPLFKFMLDKETSIEGVCIKHMAVQLESAGYRAEAGSLLLGHYSVPKVLRTLNSALSTLSEWHKR